MPSLEDCNCRSCRDARARGEAEVPRYRAGSGAVDFAALGARLGAPNDEPPVTFDDLDGPEGDELADDMAECVVCGAANDRDDMVVPADNYVSRYWDSQGNRRTRPPEERLACLDCVTYCDDCGDYWRYISDHMDRYCDSCEEYRCGNADMHYCDECDRSRCYDCGECDCYQGGAIRSYDWQPPEFVMKGDRSQVMMGIELEVSGRENVIVECVKAHDDCEEHLYMKHDGSVAGVEIVTHPGTLEWNRNEFDWDGLLSDMRDENCHIDRSENGLHVHVSRDSFSRGKGRAAHKMTWLMFLYRNHEDLQLLARRDAGRWSAFNAPVQGELKRKAERIERGDRYVAVNCNNRDTYELRFFASTLDTVEFFAAIEFADASVEYTRQLRVQDVHHGNGLSWSAFMEWAESQGDRYPALCAEGRRRVPPRPMAENKPWYPVARGRMPARSSW